jgi:acetyl esterase/lipase
MQPASVCGGLRFFSLSCRKGRIMNRVLTLSFVLIALFSGAVRAQTTSPASWVDYAAGEYDILPNITYGTANTVALKLDLYLPRNRPSPVPALLLFHGGGWVAGMKERNVMQLLPYLSMGWAVFNVEYRLASSSPAPAAVEDCLCALRWVGAHAREYNLDSTRIVVTGGSAGGHLALITGMLPPESPFYRSIPTNDAMRWREGAEPVVRVAAIVNWYGISDVEELLDGPNTKHYAIEWFGSMNNRKELAHALSPVNYVRPGLPPVISIHGDQDDIVPYAQVVRLHKALDAAAVPNMLITIPGAKHDGFAKDALVNSFAAIREFLRSNGILKKDQAH